MLGTNSFLGLAEDELAIMLITLFLLRDRVEKEVGKFGVRVARSDSDWYSHCLIMIMRYTHRNNSGLKQVTFLTTRTA